MNDNRALAFGSTFLVAALMLLGSFVAAGPRNSIPTAIGKAVQYNDGGTRRAALISTVPRGRTIDLVIFNATTGVITTAGDVSHGPGPGKWRYPE